MSDIKLTYFDARGRAEISRLILSYGGVKFTDERLTGKFRQYNIAYILIINKIAKLHLFCECHCCDCSAPRGKQSQILLRRLRTIINLNKHHLIQVMYFSLKYFLLSMQKLLSRITYYALLSRTPTS